MQLSTLATSYDDQPSHDQLFLSLPFRQSFEKFLDLFSTGVTAVGGFGSSQVLELYNDFRGANNTLIKHVSILSLYIYIFIFTVRLC